MIEKSKQRLSQLPAKSVPYIKSLRDVRVLGLIIFVVVALLVTSSGVGVIQTNYELQQKISRLEQENALRNLENQNLKLRNKYFETDQYLELQARKQFGKAALGETVLLVPESVALANTTDNSAEEAAEAAAEKPSKPSYQVNFEAWMEFLFRRGAHNL